MFYIFVMIVYVLIWWWWLLYYLLVLIDNFWTIVLEKCQSALVKINGSQRTLLDADDLMEEVLVQYQSKTCDADCLEDVSSFMVRQYVRQMTVHHMPRRYDQDVQNEFEKLIEKLLVNRHSSSSVWCFSKLQWRILGQVTVFS